MFTLDSYTGGKLRVYYLRNYFKLQEQNETAGVKLVVAQIDMNEVIEKEPERYYNLYEEIDEPVMEKVRLAVEPIGSVENVVEPAEAVSPKIGFFGRRFRQDQGWGQKAFDLMFGILLPVVCFVFDPFIFRPEIDGQAYLGSFTGFAYSLALATIAGTTISLVFSKKLGS